MIPIRRRAALALGAVALLARPARAGTKGLWQELTASADGTIPDTRCQRVFPAQHPGWGTIGPNGVFIAWNGGAFDTKRNRFTIMGGGHGDYGGNEVYGFDMAARTWARLTEPSPLAPHPTSPGNWVVQGNEAPLTRHTFGSIAYIPQIDRLAVCSGVSFGSGNIGPDPRLWLWNPDDGTWTAGPPAPATSGNGVGMVVTDDEVLHWGQFNAFARYTIALAAWQPAGNSLDLLRYTESVGAHGGGAVYVLYNESWAVSIARITVPRAKDGSWNIARVPTTGEPIPRWGGAGGITYRPIDKAFYFLSEAAVFTFDPATNIVAKASSTPWPISPQIFSKWQYVPSEDAFMLVQSGHDNVWLFHPAG